MTNTYFTKFTKIFTLIIIITPTISSRHHNHFQSTEVAGTTLIKSTKSTTTATFDVLPHPHPQPFSRIVSTVVASLGRWLKGMWLHLLLSQTVSKFLNNCQKLIFHYKHFFNFYKNFPEKLSMKAVLNCSHLIYDFLIPIQTNPFFSHLIHKILI